MKARITIVCLLIAGTLSGVFAANVLTGSSSTLTGTTTTHVLRFRFEGRVTPHRETRTFSFYLPTAATVEARLRWGNGDARLASRVRRDGRTLDTIQVISGARRQTRRYGRIRSDRYSLRVVAFRGSSHFHAVVVATWTETISDPPVSSTSSPTPDGATGSTDSPAPAPVVDTTPPVWDAAFMVQPQSVKPTLDQALTQARTFNVIVATKAMYRDYVGQMRAANPNLHIFVYLNGTFSVGDSGSNYPTTWYARDASGNKIRSVAFGNYLMDVSNAGWISDVSNRCVTFKSYSGYDGCFLDTLGTAPLNPSYVTGLPVNQATGSTWTKLDWLNATRNIAATAGASVSTPAWGNGITNGMKYFATDGGATKRLLEGGVFGGMVELFLRPPFSSATHYEKESQWLQELNMLKDSAASGRDLLTITKVWSSATQAQIDSWHRFALSSFLLGYTPGSDWFSFRQDHGALYGSSYWNAKIGTPTNAFSKVDGVYQRSFTNGRVLVNPTASTVTVSLGQGSWTTLEGGSADGSITMAPETGEVLVNA